MTLQAIRPESLKAKVCSWPAWKAAGLDGWEVEYLQQLPIEWWARVADYLDLVEQEGQWHSSHVQGYFSFIGKGAGETVWATAPPVLTVRHMQHYGELELLTASLVKHLKWLQFLEANFEQAMVEKRKE